MAADTKIQWAHHTFNPWRGCTKVAPECEHCYADTMSKRNPSTLGVWGPKGTRVVAAESYWKQPLKWDREAAAAGERRRVFCASLADVFEDWDGPMLDAQGRRLFSYVDVNASAQDGSIGMTMADVRQRLFALIDQTPHLDWLLLTKRPENVLRMWPAAGTGKDPGAVDYLRRENVWIGTSAGTQATADKAIPELLKCRDLSPVLFVSAEPLLEAVDFSCIQTAKDIDVDALSGEYRQFCDEGVDHPAAEQFYSGPHLDWIIAGGESGHGARPCHVDWIRTIRDQCRAADAAFFCKQLGADVRGSWDEFAFLPNCPSGKELVGFGDFGDGAGCADVIKLTDTKGGNIDEWPEDLQIRELPTT